MKKIIIAIVALFISMVANAQLETKPIYRHHSDGSYTVGKTEIKFTLGSYVFEKRGDDEYTRAGAVGGRFEIYVKDSDECEELYKFIKDNNELLREKYGVIIREVRKYGYYNSIYAQSHYISMKVYDKATYDTANEVLNAENERLENERQARISSLGELLK